MDDMATRRSDAPDLATIVLADRRARRRAARSGNAAWQPETELADLVTARHGFDARSALVLALVVATLAGVIGWSTTIGREQASSPPRATDAAATDAQEQDAADDARDAAARTVEAPARQSPAAAAPQGIDLEPGRITALRSGAGGGIVRIGIANRGSDPMAAEHGAQVLVLLDGEPVGERTLGAIDATAAITTELALDSCPSGRRALVVVVDPRGLVQEADERDNARSQLVSFGC